MASQVINETSADSGLQAQGIIVTCPQTYRTQTILTDDWVTAVKQAPFPDACVIVKDPKVMCCCHGNPAQYERNRRFRHLVYVLG